jgi:hypothetical protein
LNKDDKTKTAIKSAMSVADDIAAGKLSPDELEREAVEACRRVFGHVSGPHDPLWGLHCEVARQAVALGALSSGELAEWAAVFRQRPGVDAPSGEVETPRQPAASVPAEPNVPAELNDVLEPVQAPPEPQLPGNPYGAARRSVARGRGGQPDNGLRPT